MATVITKVPYNASYSYFEKQLNCEFYENENKCGLKWFLKVTGVNAV